MEQGNVNPSDKAAALFANLVMQQANAAFMFMGKVKNPETGEQVVDLDAARYFIDQMEMLETKTKGNLAPEEETLLRETLMTVRLAFVESTRQNKSAAPASNPPTSHPAPASGEATPQPAVQPATEQPPAEPAEDKKKFVKKY